MMPGTRAASATPAVSCPVRLLCAVFVAFTASALAQGVLSAPVPPQPISAQPSPSVPPPPNQPAANQPAPNQTAPNQPPPNATAASNPICVRLEGQLATFDQRRGRPEPRRPDQSRPGRHSQATGRPRPHGDAGAQSRLRRRGIFFAVLGAVAAMRADHLADPADARQPRPHDDAICSNCKAATTIRTGSAAR